VLLENLVSRGLPVVSPKVVEKYKLRVIKVHAGYMVKGKKGEVLYSFRWGKSYKYKCVTSVSN
jgi:hypothetical protein